MLQFAAVLHLNFGFPKFGGKGAPTGVGIDGVSEFL